MANSLSKKISIFPISFDRSNADESLSSSYTNGRVLSEKNISTLIRSLTDNKNFVVHADISADGKICNYIEFIIKGRYFSLDLLNNVQIGHDNATTPSYRKYKDGLWVGVKFDNDYQVNDSDNIDEYEMLKANDTPYDPSTPANTLDDYDILSGIDFFLEQTNLQNYDEHLQLLEKLSDGTIRVPIASQFKFNSRSIQNINGGIV